MTTDADLHGSIVAERRELAGVLAELSAKDWESPSLCAGWRIREVVAHMTMPFRYSLPQVILGVLRARGNFNRMADRAARRDATALSSTDLVRQLQDNADTRWKPPGGGYQGALSHDVIHGMDITIALGIDRTVPEERVRVILESQTAKQIEYFGVDLADVELRADNLDWSYGTGEMVTGHAQHLLMVLCGRRLPAGQLHGAAAGRFVTSSR